MSSILSIKKREEALDALLEILGTGKVAIMPCDTIYGLVGKAPESEMALRELKGRDRDKPFIELVTLQMANTLSGTPIPPEWKKLWPGPLTLIVKRAAGNGSVALRVPSDPFLLELIERLGSPLYSSSVNISGEQSLHDFSQILEVFGQRVPLCIEGEKEQGTTASTIVDLSGEEPHLIRQGLLDVTSLVS